MNTRDCEIPDQRGPRRTSSHTPSPPVPILEPMARALTWEAGQDGASHRTMPMEILHGLAVSPGIAIGPVVVLDNSGQRLPPRTIVIDAVPCELDRLDHAFEAALIEASLAEAEARSRLGPQYADILAAHCRMITDPSLRRDARKLIEQDQVCAEHAVLDVLEGYAVRLERLADSYLAARAADVRDIESRILSHLDRTLAAIVPGRPGGTDGRAGT